MSGAILLSAPAAQADRFLLTGGGQLDGTLLNRDQTPRSVYEIQTTQGAKITLPADQIQEVIRQPAKLSEYESLAPTFNDTVAEQWKLAEWCRQNGLKAQRETHLQRIIELEPDHVPARHGLGYVQLKGKWSNTQDDKAAQGYQLYRGQWRTAQDIAIIEKRERLELVNREWFARLKRARQTPGGLQQVAAVRDASAVPALVQLLKAERDPDAKAVYVDVLSTIATPEAVQALVYISLNEPNVEIFHAAADALERLQPRGAASEYRDALKNDNNIRINRAAHMLARLKDETAISPLIDSLITTHTVVIAPSGRGASDAVSTSFSGDGGTSFQNGQQTKTYVHVVQNQEVLSALSKLSGVTFGFDIDAWRRWHNAQRAQGGPVVDLR